MDMPLDDYIDAFARLIERFDRRMADVAQELDTLEVELAELGRAVRRTAVQVGMPDDAASP